MSCVLCYEARPWWMCWVLARLQASLLQSSVLSRGISMDLMNATWSEGPRLCAKLYICEYVGLLCRLCVIAYIMLCIYKGEAAADFFTVVMVTYLKLRSHACYIWLMFITCRYVLHHVDYTFVQILATFLFSHWLSKCDTSDKSPVFVCLSGLDLLRSHVSFILDRQTSDLCV